MADSQAEAHYFIFVYVSVFRSSLRMSLTFTVLYYRTQIHFCGTFPSSLCRRFLTPLNP